MLDFCSVDWNEICVLFFFKVGLCAVYDVQKCLFDAQLKCDHLEVMVLIQFLVAGWPGLDKGTLFLVPHVWKSHTHHSLSLQEISSLPKNR